MEKRKLMDLLEQCPVIAAVHDRYFDKAIHSPCEVIFLLGSNILTIENGTARMSDSSCPDHICENKGKIKYVGQTIVCLPNKLTVTVTGEAEDDGVDFYS